MNQIFESQNIRFVEVSEQLVGDYLTMINDVEHVRRFLGMARDAEPVTAEKEIKWVRKKLEEKAVVFSMIEKKSGEFIGNIELVRIEDSAAELGISITAAKQERGFGQEAMRAMVRYAMERLDLDRVWLKVYPDNLRAIHVYEKCGFREFDRTEKDVFMEITR